MSSSGSESDFEVLGGCPKNKSRRSSVSSSVNSMKTDDILNVSEMYFVMTRVLPPREYWTELLDEIKKLNVNLKK